MSHMADHRGNAIAMKTTIGIEPPTAAQERSWAAEWIWCSRWEGESPEAMPSPSGFPDLLSIRNAWEQQERQVRAVLNRLGPEGILRPIDYQRNGVRQAQPFWQMLQHLVNHGSFHRGQVVTMLRQLGAAPPNQMDLIAFYRERAHVTV